MKAYILVDIPEQFETELLNGRCEIEYQVFTNTDDAELIYESQYEILKPVPEKKDDPLAVMLDERYAYEQGWNACLEEIEE